MPAELPSVVSHNASARNCVRSGALAPICICRRVEITRSSQRIAFCEGTPDTSEIVAGVWINCPKVGGGIAADGTIRGPAVGTPSTVSTKPTPSAFVGPAVGPKPVGPAGLKATMVYSYRPPGMFMGAAVARLVAGPGENCGTAVA